MVPTISQVCSLSSFLEDDLPAMAGAGFTSVEIWLTKLETYLQSHSLGDFAALLAEHRLTAAVASFQGGLFDPHPERRAAAWNLFQSRLELCRASGIETLVFAADIPPPLSHNTLADAIETLSAISRAVGEAGLRAALEFQHDSAFVNNLQTAAALIEEVASPHLGLCLDVFHFFVGSSKTEDLALLSSENLFHVQLCDLCGVPRELASDADRILPGDGELCLAPILDRLREIDYRGPLSLELPNPRLWQIAPRTLGELALSSLRRLGC